MNTDQDRLRDYYARFQEWERLDSSSGALELRRALALLDAYLGPPCRILDLGGGPGRYAIELARRGHRVALADLSPALLVAARQRFAEAGMADKLESIDEVDARDLSRYQTASFDVVLAFGPLYHLLDEGERLCAAREIARVLRSNGLTFVAFIPRLNGVAALIERAASDPQQVPEGALQTALLTGAFRNGSRVGFQEGHYSTPEEIRELFESAGLAVVDTVSLRSVANRLERELSRLSGPLAEEAERLLDRTARDPAVVATSGHAVLVARKPGP